MDIFSFNFTFCYAYLFFFPILFLLGREKTQKAMANNLYVENQMETAGQKQSWGTNMEVKVT